MHSFMNEEGLFFCPLGGSEQFGINLNLYICNGEILAIDCGIGFADERFPGIDLLLPDVSLLETYKDDLKGLIITHAHEDHIGAVPYLWERLQCPIYTGRFSAAVLRKKFEEVNFRNTPVHTVEAGQSIHVGSAFQANFVPVSHSIPDTCSIILNTPHGRVVHSGDWNLDPAPVVGDPTNPKPFQKAGSEGVLAYIGDSTNAEVSGRAGSEGDIEQGMAELFKNCSGRIAVTIFSSNIGRVKSIARAAKQAERDVGIIGRSLHRMIGAAYECGFLDDLPEFVPEEDLECLPKDKMVAIVTGSQGEYRSALAKIARGEFSNFKLEKGDTVIFSARAIPGNERHINNVKNNLSAAGVHVITPESTSSKIHVSGHPCRDEIADMLSWVRPRYLIPVHGERKQLDAQAELSRACQIEQAIVPCNGSVIRLAPGTAEIVEDIPTEILALDQKRIVPASHQSIVARRKLQYTGALHLSLVLDVKGEVMGRPRLNTVGLIDEDCNQDAKILERLENEILAVLEDMTWEERLDDHFVEEELRICLRRFIVHLLGMKPKTTIHVLRV